MSKPSQPIDEADVHAYVDGRLSDERRIEFERRLELDPDLAARVDAYFSLNAALHARYDAVLNEPHAHVRRSAMTRAGHAHGRWMRFGGMAAMLVLGLGMGAGADRYFAPGAHEASDGAGDPQALTVSESLPFARQAALIHVVYMPSVARPDGMAQGGEQGFVRWLSARLGTDVQPPSLATQGFELTGGRLVAGANGGMIVFMYRGQTGERVTLCVSRRASAGGTSSMRLFRDGPVNVFYWIEGDSGYAVSGGIDPRVLHSLADTAFRQTSAQREE